MKAKKRMVREIEKIARSCNQKLGRWKHNGATATCLCPTTQFKIVVRRQGGSRSWYEAVLVPVDVGGKLRPSQWALWNCELVSTKPLSSEDLPQGATPMTPDEKSPENVVSSLF